MTSTDKTPTPNARKGFASMSADKQRAIASKGGQAVKASSRSFYKDRNLAVTAGRLGGKAVPPTKRSFSQSPELASAAGKKGGSVSGARKAAQAATQPTA